MESYLILLVFCFLMRYACYTDVYCDLFKWVITWKIYMSNNDNWTGDVAHTICVLLNYVSIPSYNVTTRTTAQSCIPDKIASFEGKKNDGLLLCLRVYWCDLRGCYLLCVVQAKQSLLYTFVCSLNWYMMTFKAKTWEYRG